MAVLTNQETIPQLENQKKAMTNTVTPDISLHLTLLNSTPISIATTETFLFGTTKQILYFHRLCTHLLVLHSCCIRLGSNIVGGTPLFSPATSLFLLNNVLQQQCLLILLGCCFKCRRIYISCQKLLTFHSHRCEIIHRNSAY